MRVASPTRDPLLAFTALLAGGALVADGIESRPLSFAKGASSGTAKGSIHGRQTIDYELRARAGQTMSVTLKSGNRGVARAGGGTATVVVTRPDGRKRAIFFDKGRATCADLRQADGNMAFRASKEADLVKVQAGDERYEIPEAVVFGG